MESLLPIVSRTTLPPADDPTLPRMLELVACLQHAPWAELELAVGEPPESRRFSFGMRETDGCAVLLRCRPPYSATLRLPSGSPPDGLTATVGFVLDQILHAHQLGQQTVLLRSAIDAFPDAILVFDLPGDILHANAAADQLLSRQTEFGLEVVNRGCGARPLVDRLCEEAADVATAVESDRRHVLPLSDGSALACAVTRLAGTDRPLGVLVRLRTLGATAELALATFVSEHALSPREAEVMKLLQQGHSTAQIGEQLAISTHTVRDHLKNLYRKTGTSSRSELVGLLARHPGG